MPVGVFSPRVYRAPQPQPRLPSRTHAAPPIVSSPVPQPSSGVTSQPRVPSYPGVAGRWAPPPGGTPAPVLPLPLVVTVGVNAVTATSVNLIGAVDPNGSTTNWWFIYGVTQPPVQQTVVQSAGSGNASVTVTFQVTGLTSGVTYSFQLVGQSAAGTVYGAPMTFTAVAQQQTVTPISFVQPTVTTPHFAVPFRFQARSGALVVDQGSTEEVLSCVEAIMECPLGACPEVSGFGYSSPVFSQAPGLTASQIVAEVRRLEPRATVDAVTQLLQDGTSWGLTLTTSTSSDAVT